MHLPTAVVLFLILPMRWVAAARLGFHIVPPHVFGALAVGPKILAGDTAGMAADALVQMKHHGNLRTNIHRSAPLATNSIPEAYARRCACRGLSRSVPSS